MKIDIFQRAVLTQSLPEDGVWAGDVGTVVHHYPTGAGQPDGYEVEFFSANGDTVAVVSVSEDILRAPTHEDRLAVRLNAG